MQIKKGRGMKVIILSNTDWFIHTTPTQVCSPEDMVGFTESAKCAMIRKIFDDAYRFILAYQHISISGLTSF